MTSERKQRLLEFIDSEITKAEENALKTDEASKFVVTGPSQSGDKYHAENASNLAKRYLERLQELKEEISKAMETIAEKVAPVCFVEVEYSDQSRLQFILVDKGVSLTRHLFISKNSPLGASIIGKSVGESFSYRLNEGIDGVNYSGKVVNIE